MPIAILVNGAFGRMGQLTTKTIQEHPDFELVGQTGREYDLKKSIKDSGAQVVIDFTNPESVFENTSIIIDTGAHPVIGTTGLQPHQIIELQKRCDQLKLGGLIAPNFSIGAVLMMKYAKEIAQYMTNVEIVEMHHEEKVDSPSGTALRSAEVIAEAIHNINQPIKPSRESIPGSRGARYRGIPIHAVRLPGFLSQQDIIFGETGETLTLRHTSIDRRCFMPGVCFACEKVMKLDRLIYGLEEIL